MTVWSLADSVLLKRPYLMEDISFEDIVSSIKADLKITCFNEEQCNKEGYFEYYRPTYNLLVSKRHYDLFFNGKDGYRSRYLQSPQIGEAANSFLLANFLNILINHSFDKNFRLSQQQIIKSLAFPSAKAWIKEDNKLVKNYNVQPIEVTVSKWVDFAYKAEQDMKEDLYDYRHVKAVWGVKAPEGMIIEIKGGFVNLDLEEWVPEHKKLRAEQINKYGFS